MVIPAIARPLPFRVLFFLISLKKVIPKTIANILVKMFIAGNQKNSDNMKDTFAYLCVSLLGIFLGI